MIGQAYEVFGKAALEMRNCSEIRIPVPGRIAKCAVHQQKRHFSSIEYRVHGGANLVDL